MTEERAEHNAATPRWGRGQVVQRRDSGWYWHVVARLVDVDSGRVRYEIADPTHTRYEMYREEDAVVEFENAGFRLSPGMKPAAVFGKRVEGILYGYNDEPHQPVEEA